MTFKITTANSLEFIYKDHSYRVFKPKSKGQDLKALTKVFKHCESMLSHYSKVFVARIELSTKAYSANNQIFLMFIKKQLSILSKQYSSRVSYICARERNASSNHHYHLAVLLSGHKINHSHKLTHQLKHAWESQGLGSASFVKHPYYVMQRGNKQSVGPAIYRLSYLTKQATKEKHIKAHSYLFNKLIHSPERDCKRFKDILLVNPAFTYQQSLHNALVKSSTSNIGGLHTKDNKFNQHKNQQAHLSTQVDQYSIADNDHLSVQHSMHRRPYLQAERSLYLSFREKTP
ncbi:inovirus-type Gp2 protein [Pseudoalteromonas sp. TAB23]|uniref:YagK/YfjJ domain-containing protein n=1 Tax=Pseudoalteromonas sp. TAB23 TaxID=1938595 RepID=UPI0004230815|nr:inovirus-type Gp2 protein [Pseudoalteromonas sp. TAB23]